MENNTKHKVIAFLRHITFKHIYNQPYSYYCGYVGIKDANSLPDSVQRNIVMFDDFENSLDNKISIHGGITYDNTFIENVSIIPLTDIPANWYEYRCIGFDMNHVDDEAIRDNYDFAKAEAISLKEQIEKLL